jgi:hypothetical protein
LEQYVTVMVNAAPGAVCTQILPPFFTWSTAEAQVNAMERLTGRGAGVFVGLGLGVVVGAGFAVAVGLGAVVTVAAGFVGVAAVVAVATDGICSAAWPVVAVAVACCCDAEPALEDGLPAAKVKTAQLTISPVATNACMPRDWRVNHGQTLCRSHGHPRFTAK